MVYIHPLPAPSPTFMGSEPLVMEQFNFIRWCTRLISTIIRKTQGCLNAFVTKKNPKHHNRKLWSDKPKQENMRAL